MPPPESIALLGPAAGVLTSVLWTFTSIFFAAAGRRIGSTVVNAVRIGLAVVILAVIHRYLISVDGSWIPSANGRQVLLLALSGVIGLTLGDQALFTAFVDIGPRLSSLLMTTSPIFATLFAWVMLGERLGGVAWLGMSVTIAGVGWVILERPRATRPGGPSPHRVRGIVLAVTGAACQACGLMLSKAGMGHGWLAPEEHLDPQAATLVRMFFAGVGVAPLLILWHRRRRRLEAAGHDRPTARAVRTGFAFTIAGTVVGPVLGVWLSLVAADATSVGIAQTLLSLTPIFILPYAHFFDHEHVTRRAVIGALIAVAGVGVLFTQA